MAALHVDASGIPPRYLLKPLPTSIPTSSSPRAIAKIIAAHEYPQPITLVSSIDTYAATRDLLIDKSGDNYGHGEPRSRSEPWYK